MALSSTANRRTASTLLFEEVSMGPGLETPLPSPGRRLRDAWAAGTVAVPGVFNALVARMAERLGFQAIYLSGGALSAASGVPDVGLLTLTEFVGEAERMARATPLPLLCDADTGFGEALERRADRPPLRSGRRRGHSPRGPAAAQALRPSVGQAARGARGDGGQAPGGGGGAARPRFRHHRPHRRPRRDGFDDAVRRRACIPRGRGRRHLSRGAGDRGEFAAFAGAVRRRCWPT